MISSELASQFKGINDMTRPVSTKMKDENEITLYPPNALSKIDFNNHNSSKRTRKQAREVRRLYDKHKYLQFFLVLMSLIHFISKAVSTEALIHYMLSFVLIKTFGKLATYRMIS